jgi:hypothetical protein
MRKPHGGRVIKNCFPPMCRVTPTIPPRRISTRGATRPAIAAGLQHGAQGAPVSLCLHIPFCDTLCWFCGCNTTAATTYSLVRSYCDLPLKEIAMVSSALGRRGAKAVALPIVCSCITAQAFARKIGSYQRPYQQDQHKSSTKLIKQLSEMNGHAVGAAGDLVAAICAVRNDEGVGCGWRELT